MVLGQDPGDLYQRDGEAELAFEVCSAPGMGRDEASKLEEPSPAEGDSVEEFPR